jgi:archaea-specific DNA-binding protein
MTEKKITKKEVSEESSEVESVSASPGENMVYVGQKGTSAYVLAVLTQFSKGTNTVTIKARGRTISRAVDVAEIIKNKPEAAAKIDSIKTTTEEVETQDGKPLKVSAIEIVLKK